jgi:cytochrome P450
MKRKHLEFSTLIRTAHTLTWCFYFLCQNPKYQQMICDEAVKEFGDEKILSYEKLSNGFKFTKALISETLRLKNPAYITARYCFEDTEVDGYKIPKHSMVVLGFCNAGMSEKIWGSDAKEFRPERFFEKDPDELRYIFTPFSMGPRVCIGKRFSEMEMILILVKSMMKFRIKPTESISKVEEIIALTMKPSIPVVVSIEHYNKV